MQIGFIGLGHMGGPMAQNLLKKGYAVVGFDLVEASITAHKQAGGTIANSVPELAAQCEVIFTMLPASQHVQNVCLGKEGIFAHAKPNTLIIDCSSIDVATARSLAEQAKNAKLSMLDAPVSGGMTGAQAGTLTFMVGGDKENFERAQPILQAMGKNIFHTGKNGTGQAAKICNNMLLGISMIGTCEAISLAEKLGLDVQTFFDVCSVSSGQCWSLTQYCPAPGPVPRSPANHDYQAGFTAAMMLKDLKLSQNEAAQNNLGTPLGALATALYGLFNEHGYSQKDFSGIFNFINGKKLL